MKNLGIYPEHIDPAIRPGDDLFRHVNGGWLRETEIPSDKPYWGAFFEVRERSEEQVRAIIEEICAKEDDSLNAEELLVKRLYTKYMDLEAIEGAGLVELQGVYREIDQISTLDDFFKVAGKLDLLEAEGLFSYFVSFDDKDSSKMIAQFYQGGLTLPDRDYYLLDEHADVVKEYKKYISAISAKVNRVINPKIILDFEKKIAAIAWDQVKLRESELNYNKTTYANLVKTYPNIKFEAWLGAGGVVLSPESEVNVGQPTFFEGLNSLLTDTDLSVLKEWLCWAALDGLAEYLVAELGKQSFEFWGKVINGVDEEEPRWRDAVDFVEGCAGEALGKVYVKRYYPEEASVKMDKLIANLLKAYEQAINEAEWMGEETKKRAVLKLSKFNPKVGYPKSWKDYSGLKVEKSDSLINTLEKANLWHKSEEYKDLSRAVDRDRWYMTPQTVNAYYLPNLNEIVFPAGILQDPFFFPYGDDAINYGSIGATIGHEIGHGFDDQGSKYDGDGNMVSWWSEEDLKNFNELTNKLINQFNNLSLPEADGAKVNGALTVGENIGDLIGLSVAYRAYLLSREGESEEDIIEGYNPMQRFFLGWAGSWREKGRKEALVNALLTDPHSPSEFRCNQIVANIDGFYDAFDVKEGDALFINPDERVKIW